MPPDAVAEQTPDGPPLPGAGRATPSFELVVTRLRERTAAMAEQHSVRDQLLALKELHEEVRDAYTQPSA
eukprot:COSAG02_NODE_280_length_25797_cov_66.644447_5_plen_70_part_00